MAYNYSQYVTDLANMIVVPATDPNYNTVLPNSTINREIGR